MKSIVTCLIFGLFIQSQITFAQNELIPALDPFIMYAQPGYSQVDGLRHNDVSYLEHPDFGKLTFNSPNGRNVVEVLSKRTLDERYYIDLNDETFFYIEKSNTPINFYQGEFLRAIDPTLYKVNDFYYESGAQPVPTALDLMNQRVILKLGDHQLGLSKIHLETTSFDGQINIIEADWSSAVIGNSGAYIENIFPGIDMKVIFKQGGFKTEYIIKYNLGVKEFKIVDEMDLPETYSLMMSGDEITSLFVQIYDTETGDTEVVIDPARIKDASGSRTSWICPYLIENHTVKLFCDSTMLNSTDKIYPLTIDPLFTAVGPITSAFGIRGSLLTPGSCNHSLNVTFPGGSTPWDVSANWSVYTDFCAGTLLIFGFIDDCWMSDAQVWLTSSCGGASPVGAPGIVWTCPGCFSIGTWAPTLPFASSGTQSLAQCYTPSCANQVLTFTIFDNRTYCNAFSIYDNCTWADSYCVSLDQWSVTVQGRTLETLGNTVTGNGTATINDADCIGTALLDPTPLYGVAPYTYSWSTGATTPTISVGVTPAVYTCTVTTACGSSVVATFNIGCPLSADQTNFNTELIDQDVHLSWQMTSESGLKNYRIERASFDGVFEVLAEVSPSFLSENLSYTFVDNHPLNGLNYYRIGFVYETGDIKYSETKSIVFSDEQVYIIPNPSNDYFTLFFESNENETYQILFYNSAGELCRSEEYKSTSEYSQMTLSKNNLSTGYYNLVIKGYDKTLRTKLIIQ